MNKNLKETVREIRHQSRQLVRELDVIKGFCRGSRYTFSQCHVMFELNQHKALTLLELADNLLIDKSNISRTVKKLMELGLVKSQKVKSDQRQKLFSLTAQGEKALQKTNVSANAQVQQALAVLEPTQWKMVVEGIALYANALRKSRLQSQFNIRAIRKPDNLQVARIIREVMTEFQAVGEGYSIGDPEVDDMFGSYRGKDSCYYVIVHDGSVVGGGGLAKLAAGNKTTCEIQKMFFLPPARGIGLGQKLLKMLLDQARKRGYKTCYLETLDRMWQANALYKKFGFELLKAPMGKTGHCSCDRWYALKL